MIATNPRATIGGNNPPDPIDEICSRYESMRMEAENWLDGEPVQNDPQMQAVDVLRESMRQMRLELEGGQKSASAPLHDAWKAELARWKPTIEDVRRIEAGLIALVNGFKRKRAEEKAAAERKAREESEAARRRAEEAAATANPSDIEAQRAAAQAQQQAEDAQRAAALAAKDKVKGLRSVTRYEIEDHRAALHWIALHDRPEMTAFIEDYVRKNHKTAKIDGVRVWKEKEAF